MPTPDSGMRMPLRIGLASIRTRFLFVLLGGAVLPLALIGAWLARSSERAGETLLRSQLEESLAGEVASLADRWRFVQADMLLLADNDVVWRHLLAPPASSATIPPYLLDSFQSAPATVEWLRYSDGNRRTRISFSSADRATGRAAIGGGLAIGGTTSGSGLASPTSGSAPAVGAGENGGPGERPVIEVTLPVHDDQWRAIGWMSAGLHLTALIPSLPSPRAVGAVFGVRDGPTGELLLGDGAIPEAVAGRFARDGEAWIGVTHALQQPPLTLQLAAPLDPVVAPFARTARSGGTALLLIAALVVVVTTLLTTRMTGPIVAATRAAEAIAAGRMDQRVPAHGDDEVGRLGRAFNAMAASLRDTLDALAVQRTQAALGEFATSLAHEVRNAHTTIGLDLQRVIRGMDDRPAERAILERSLRRVRNVDRVVDGALRVARSGRLTFEPVDLREVLSAAERAAQPWFEERGAILVIAVPPVPLPISGNAAALETMFVNLLRNAAQALDAGGKANLSAVDRGSFLAIELRDEGGGMSEEQLATAFQLFVTGRPDGTGLGLSIARQIALAHGSDIQIESESGKGTRCSLRFAKHGSPTPPARHVPSA
jgi:signal transduction histidine kinase